MFCAARKMLILNVTQKCKVKSQKRLVVFNTDWMDAKYDIVNNNETKQKKVFHKRNILIQVTRHRDRSNDENLFVTRHPYWVISVYGNTP